MSKKSKCFLLVFCFIFIDFIFAQTQEKTVLAVITLETTNISENDAVTITNFLQQELFFTGRYKLVERAQVDKALKEHERKYPGVCDLKCAATIGKRLSADKVVLGSVGTLGATYTIQIKMLDIETNEIESMSSIVARGQLSDLPNSLGNLVNRLIIPPERIEPQVEEPPEELPKKTIKEERPTRLTRSKLGKIKIKVYPYADVLIDGKIIGEIPPIRVQDVVPGKHIIEFVSSRLNKNFTIEVTIKAGESKEIRMNMETGDCKILNLTSMPQ